MHSKFNARKKATPANTKVEIAVSTGQLTMGAWVVTRAASSARTAVDNADTALRRAKDARRAAETAVQDFEALAVTLGIFSEVIQKVTP